MAIPSEPPRRLVRFGPFALDLRTKELRRDGVRLKLHGIPVEVLTALVERPGDLVTRRELRERLWSEDTFLDYENSLNSAVARLREALGDAPDRPVYVETLPKRGYRFLADVEFVEHEDAAARDQSAGPTAVAQASPSESTPAAPLAAVTQGLPARPFARRRLVIAGATAAIVAILAVWGVPALRRSEASGARVMLVVLPFVNLSGSAEHDYLSDGFTEEIITQLARANTDRLGVIARTTAMRFKGATDVAQVGRELRVDYVLEGSVRQRDDALRITAQLIRVADQTHVWAETFDRTAVSLLQVERDVSEAVSRQVHLLVGSRPAPPPDRRRPHPDAYAAYLRARYHHAQATVQGLEQAIQGYRTAVRLDPDYALAYAGLARAYIFGVRMRPIDALRQAHDAARTAVAMDPELPEAQLAVAMTKLYYEWDWVGSEREFRRAIERDAGNADAHFYYSHLLAALGRHDEAIAAARRAQQLDPHSTLIGHYVGRHYFMARRYDDALAELTRTLELDPNYGWTHVFLFLTYEKLHRFEDALVHRQKYLALIGRPAHEASDLAARYATKGYAGVLEQWIGMTLGYLEFTGHLTSAEIVHGHAALGRVDDALDWLDRAVEDRTRDLIYLAVDPGYDPIGTEPRYRAHVARLGLATPPPTR